MLLLFLNRLLSGAGQENITDLLEFSNIPRSVLISKTSKDILLEMDSVIFSVFNKVKCDWYSRRIRKHYILCFLRHACKRVGYKLTYRIKNVGVDNGYRSMTTLYSISLY